jgi:hypothetical protein
LGPQHCVAPHKIHEHADHVPVGRSLGGEPRVTNHTSAAGAVIDDDSITGDLFHGARKLARGLVGAAAGWINNGHLDRL